MEHTRNSLYQLELSLDHLILKGHGHRKEYPTEALLDLLFYLYKFDYPIDTLSLEPDNTVKDVFNSLKAIVFGKEDNKNTISPYRMYAYLSQIIHFHQEGVPFKNSEPIEKEWKGEIASLKKIIIRRMIRNWKMGKGDDYSPHFCANQLCTLINYIYFNYDCDNITLFSNGHLVFKTLKKLKDSVNKNIMTGRGGEEIYRDHIMFNLINVIELLWNTNTPKKITSFYQYCEEAKRRFTSCREHLESGEMGSYDGPNELTVFQLVTSELKKENDTTSPLAVKTAALWKVIKDGNVLEF